MDKQIYQEIGKRRFNDFFKLEIKKDTNEIISNKITYKNFKLNDSKKYLKLSSLIYLKNTLQGNLIMSLTQKT